VRGVGWEFAHVAIDDASRLAYAEVLPDEGRDASSAFLERALVWFAALDVRVERIMTDNAPAYRSRRFATLCRRHRIRHLRTRPYTPRTNGKAECFIQTALREWAYHRPYASSHLRTAGLTSWLHHYDRHRPRAVFAGLPPRSRVPMTNLLKLHS
jgi:transposase InsO family protein